MREPVVSEFDTKENLFLKFLIPSLDTSIWPLNPDIFQESDCAPSGMTN